MYVSISGQEVVVNGRLRGHRGMRRFGFIVLVDRGLKTAGLVFLGFVTKASDEGKRTAWLAGE